MYVIEDTLSATSLMLVYNSIFNLFITNDNLTEVNNRRPFSTQISVSCYTH